VSFWHLVLAIVVALLIVEAIVRLETAVRTRRRG
jgi:hypothetical protein